MIQEHVGQNCGVNGTDGAGGPSDGGVVCTFVSLISNLYIVSLTWREEGEPTKPFDGGNDLRSRSLDGSSEGADLGSGSDDSGQVSWNLQDTTNDLEGSSISLQESNTRHSQRLGDSDRWHSRKPG